MGFLSLIRIHYSSLAYALPVQSRKCFDFLTTFHWQLLWIQEESWGYFYINVEVFSEIISNWISDMPRDSPFFRQKLLSILSCFITNASVDSCFIVFRFHILNESENYAMASVVFLFQKHFANLKLSLPICSILMRVCSLLVKKSDKTLYYYRINSTLH